MNPIVTVLRVDDIPAVCEIWHRVRKASEFPVGAHWSPEAYRDEVDRGRGWGVFVEGQLRAFAFFRNQPGGLEILQLATDPAVGRKGLMGLLLGRILQGFAPREAWLEVHEGNLPALRFYEGLGFQRNGYRKAYYSDGAGAILMVKR